MLKDIISVIIGEEKFIIDLQLTPIILNAVEYLSISNFNNLNDKKIIFDEKYVELIDLSDFLDVNLLLPDSSKILVGEIDSKFIGILVDKVVEIININDFSEYAVFEKITTPKPYIKDYLNISGELMGVIDVEEIISQKIIN